jgi:hypothetical protein
MTNRYALAGGMSRGTQLTLKASGAETASTTGAPVVADVEDTGGSLYVSVAVTAVAGTAPTLLVAIEGSQDLGATWVKMGTIGGNGFVAGTYTSAGSPGNFSAAGTISAVFPRTQMVRSRSTIGGSAGQSFTYSVSAVAC